MLDWLSYLLRTLVILMGLPLKSRYLDISTSRSLTSWVWWYMTIIPEFGRLRQEIYEFKDSVCHIGRTCPKHHPLLPPQNNKMKHKKEDSKSHLQ
jgi:hypothetical protein